MIVQSSFAETGRVAGVSRRNEIQLHLDAAIETLKHSEPGSRLLAMRLHAQEAPFVVVSVEKGWKMELEAGAGDVMMWVQRA